MIFEAGENYRGKLIENERMSKHTTFKIGGTAKVYAEPADRESLIWLLSKIKEADMRYFVLGNGSNVLFDDNGFNGVVISTSFLDKISIDGSFICAEAGAPLTYIASNAMKNGLGGIEFLYGIPGSIGGAVYMNAGAYEHEIKEVLEYSEYLDSDTLTVNRLNIGQHEFGYRESVYKKHPERILLSAKLKLHYGDREKIKSTMDDYMSRRVEKQPLEYPSAGSVFKRYPGRYTGKLIEDCGLKGYMIGGAQVSDKHAGFIVNRKNATSEDVLMLIKVIKEEVYKKYGINIECEIIYVC